MWRQLQPGYREANPWTESPLHRRRIAAVLTLLFCGRMVAAPAASAEDSGALSADACLSRLRALKNSLRAAGRKIPADGEHVVVDRVEAINLRTARLGPSHPSIAKLLKNRAVVLVSRNDLEGAAWDLRRALAVLEAAGEAGSDSLTQGITLALEQLRAAGVEA
eukprot:gnl/TRDRNA2_/TRDRNA2_141347_c0_seq6.p1 gnl/TRDRNA2_/TRDRNA2_141347_c0~~gnl/TRDRNA2_/TRDRNA2_141347_c0_seq6.p1  ORF type:complete len:187 (-),score=34.24 gnl/TRDRNA2_/TRDRNA2_141347_c0_seq6:55-546(-)